MKITLYKTKLVTGLLFFVSLYSSSSGELEDPSLYPIIINEEADKAVVIVLQGNDGCHIVQDVSVIKRIVSTREEPHVYEADDKTVDDLINLCGQYQSDQINATQFVVGLQQKSILIFPGTHFCGAGNNAANYSDLGYYEETDKCCREHDMCTNFVEGWSCHANLTELCNPSPFTRSHCSCDYQFRECLQKSNDTASYHIGVLFFTLFGLKCFRNEYPIIKCEQYGGFLHIHCQRYQLNYTQPRMYQFFDSPKYFRGTLTPVTALPSTTMVSQKM